jgi:hypothetical protein
MEKHYLAIAEASGDGHSWWISFPGLPGVVSGGEQPRADHTADAGCFGVGSGGRRNAATNGRGCRDPTI